MLRMCVLTVFRETDSSPAISTLDRLVGRYRRTLSSPGLSSSAGGVTTDAAAVLVRSGKRAFDAPVRYEPHDRHGDVDDDAEPPVGEGQANAQADI